MNGQSHPSNHRSGKQPSTAGGHHNRRAGAAKALHAIGKRRGRRNSARFMRQIIASWSSS